MHTSSLIRRSNLLIAIAICGTAFLALPQRAQAFFGSCEKKCLLAGALGSVAQQTGRKVIVINTKGAVVADSCKTCAKACPKDKPAGKGHIYINNLRTGEIYPEIKQTLADGQTRGFSATGPDGVKFKKSITALRNSKGRIIGAVIVITQLKS